MDNTILQQPTPIILLVDDEEAVQKPTCKILEMASYKIESAYNGYEALDKLSNQVYDILIIDLKMPLMDGTTLIKEIRKSDSNIPIIVLSAYVSLETATSLLRNYSISDFIQKPLYPIEVFLFSIEKALESQRQREKLQRNTVVFQKGDDSAKIDNKEICQILNEIVILALQCWKLATSKTKIDLAEESGMWSVYLEKTGTYKTRTLDRYLSLLTLPEKPRWRPVLGTAHFVLKTISSETPYYSELQQISHRLTQLLHHYSG